MKNSRSIFFWTLIFACIFLLTQSHHIIAYSPKPGLLGLPIWLWVYMGFHLILVIAMLVFSWKSEKI